MGIRKNYSRMIILMGPNLFQFRIVKNTWRGTHFGLEILRRLIYKYNPENSQPNSTLLKKVLHPQHYSLDKVRTGRQTWVNLKKKYEERRKK